jgi:hypothetical protein
VPVHDDLFDELIDIGALIRAVGDERSRLDDLLLKASPSSIRKRLVTIRPG